MAKTSANQPKNYESALHELEALLVSLEGGQLSLEQSIEAYRRGALLLGYCQSQLADAEQRIKVLEGNTLQDFQGDGPPD